MLNTDIDLVAYGDDELFRYAERVKDKVVLITDASNGIGRETAIRFAFYGRVFSLHGFLRDRHT